MCSYGVLHALNQHYISVYIMEMLTTLFRAKLTRQFADMRCAAGA